MSKLYLVTGFLGAGKTTFLKNFIRLFVGQKIQLIVNEFGKEGVDGILLADLGAFLEEISGGSVFCSCRLDQFEKVLRETSKIDPDVILVEASGLSDPTGVRKLFSQTNRFPNIDYQGAVCLVDAVRFPKIYATARTSVKQLASSDVVIVNKTDCATDEELTATLAQISGQRPDMPVIQTSFGRIEGNLLELMADSKKNPAKDMPLTADLSMRKIMVSLAATISPYELKKFIEMFVENTFRVKGFVETTEGLYLADCVDNVVSVSPWKGQDIPADRIGWLNILAGTAMPAGKAVKEACSWYSVHVLEVA